MKYFISILLSTIIWVSPVFAQFDESAYGIGVNAGDIDVVIKPEYPNAFQTVTLRLQSNSVDLNRYRIQWIINGQIASEGIGFRDFSTTVGDYGSSTNITINLDLGYTVVKKQISLSPQDSTVLWEAVDSSVPPFYRGKKLPARESNIRITAIPHFSSITGLSTDDAVFLWERNGNKILNIGGYAKNSILIEQNRMRTEELITAILSSRDERSSSRQTVTIPTINPEIHWYTKDTAGYRKLQNINAGARIARGNINLVAEPYFFSINNLSNLIFDWKMNNQQIYLNETSKPNELTVNNPMETGQVTFNLSLENNKTFLQTANKSVSLFFDNPKN